MMKDIGLSVVVAIVLVVAVNLIANIAMIPNHYDSELAPLNFLSSDAEEPAEAGESAKEEGGVDVAAGAKVFKKCKACHNAAAGAKAKTGPNLWAVVGRAKASMEGFKYSNALKGLGGSWSAEELNGFLTKPKDFAPGNKMTFPGVKKDDQRANLIAYLATLKD